jgi:hypothetical protein
MGQKWAWIQKDNVDSGIDEEILVAIIVTRWMSFWVINVSICWHHNRLNLGLDLNWPWLDPSKDPSVYVVNANVWSRRLHWSLPWVPVTTSTLTGCAVHMFHKIILFESKTIIERLQNVSDYSTAIGCFQLQVSCSRDFNIIFIKNVPFCS